MADLLDLTGQRFGRLLVIRRGENTTRGQAQWVCKCDCGNTKQIASASLVKGATKSCGCLRKEMTKQRGLNNKTHGLSKKRLYYEWVGMRQRCTYEKDTKEYANYGGRGITVCDLWMNDFLAFAKWALANGYKDNLTLDRVDNNRGYSPENCRWATVKQQSNNRRTNRILEYKGKRLTLTEWSEILGINKNTILSRLRRGWSVEKSLMGI